MLKKNSFLWKMARSAKRSGKPVSVVTEGLRKDLQYLIPEIEAEYNRFKPRKS